MKSPTILSLDVFDYGSHQVITSKLCDSSVDGGIVRHFPSKMVCVPRAVGSMKVDHDVGIVIVQHLHHRPSLGRVELHVVPIDIEPLRVCANSHPADRAVLRSTICQ